MPRYTYKCKCCEHSFEIVHSMSEKKKDCPSCNKKDSLFRPPNTFTKKAPKKPKVGDIVEQFIEDTKKDVALEKDKMRKEEYKP